MSAKNGSAVTMQKRGLIGLCVAVAIVLCAVFSSAASAYAPIKETYLALGDSYAFGYSLQQENENAKTGDLATLTLTGATVGNSASVVSNSRWGKRVWRRFQSRNSRWRVVNSQVFTLELSRN